ncbi:MAG: hypothetical protein Q7J09_10315 [Methanocalculus sp.]|uniref:hypothetical protein n=1 Tax=Methanocalculus sp. TaxID=2004547 RepID=UPI0027274B58|nr:hypothetical protein [Methanocalculus sp.]MDO9540378.1 hypothetical protein [Methanocalculus sp.]
MTDNLITIAIGPGTIWIIIPIILIVIIMMIMMMRWMRKCMRDGECPCFMRRG